MRVSPQKCWLVLLGATFFPGKIMTAPPSSDPFPVKQPDGKTFPAVLKGSQFYYWHETEEGYLVAQDSEDGFWKYAVFTNDSLEPQLLPDAIVGKVDPADFASQGLVAGSRPNMELLAAHIREQEPQPQALPEPQDSPTMPQKATDTPADGGEHEAP
jgi:hypothetical protein